MEDGARVALDVEGGEFEEFAGVAAEGEVQAGEDDDEESGALPGAEGRCGERSWCGAKAVEVTLAFK